jgi:cold shock CspA family protein
MGRPMTPPAGRRSGRVAEFDESAGLGVIADPGERGGGAGRPAEYPFHCTQIADGSRTIAVGTPVTFEARAGRSGRWEAYAISPA